MISHLVPRVGTYVKEALGDVSLIYFGCFGFIICVGIQSLVGDDVVFQKCL